SAATTVRLSPARKAACRANSTKAILSARSPVGASCCSGSSPSLLNVTNSRSASCLVRATISAPSHIDLEGAEQARLVLAAGRQAVNLVEHGPPQRRSVGEGRSTCVGRYRARADEGSAN